MADRGTFYSWAAVCDVDISCDVRATPRRLDVATYLKQGSAFEGDFG